MLLICEDGAADGCVEVEVKGTSSCRSCGCTVDASFLINSFLVSVYAGGRPAEMPCRLEERPLSPRPASRSG
jgi:hypothetical protein